MNEGFVSTILLPEEWDIYGWKLRQFSLRLYMHLDVVDSPFVRGQSPNAHDTFQFLKICSNKHDDVFKIKKATLLEKLFYARLIYDQRFHAKVYLRIVQYLKDNTFNPNTTVRSRFKFQDEIEEEIVKPQNTLPEQLVVVAVFANKLHIEPEKTWNLPIGMIGWYSAAIAMLEGADVSVDGSDDTMREDINTLAEWEQKQAEAVRLAMVNGRIPKKKIKLSSE